jgi:hypothetical protein
MAPSSTPVLAFLSCVESCYAALIAHSAPARQEEPCLGGKLLYVSGLKANCRALIVAANIAGAATIVSCDDPDLQRQANRDGVLDFSVTSLDEALRILKNEIRKRQPVAVCVALAPETVEAEMRERGVEADLNSLSPAPDRAMLPCEVLLSWSVASAPARWLPRLDALAADCLAPDDLIGRRWLRLAPRYLGRLAQNVRLMRCSRAVAEQFTGAVRQRTESGELDVVVVLRLETPGNPQVLEFRPPIRSVQS